MTSWSGGWWNAYIVTNSNADTDQIITGLNKLLDTHLAEEASNYAPVIRNITDLHFDSDFEWVNDWLQTFAYHIDLSWYIFLGAIAVVSLISLLTISFETLKAALLNPIEFIRNE